VSKTIQIAFYFRTFKALFVSGCDQVERRGELVEFMFGFVYLKLWVQMGERIAKLFST